MTAKEKIESLLESSADGTITAAQVTEAGMHRGVLQELVERGELYRFGRGLYVRSSAWEDDFSLLQRRYGRGIYSNDTALYLLGYSDRTPAKYTMTFPKGYNAPSLRQENLIVRRVVPENYMFGQTQIASPSGNPRLRFGTDDLRHSARQRQRRSACRRSHETLCRLQRQEHAQTDAVCGTASRQAQGDALHGDFAMITRNPMQLKAFIKNKSAQKHISAQLVMQNYMLERLLERISLSPYRRHFILKGGFLISAIVGLDTRATMDLDTTIKGFTLTRETIRQIFTEICAVPIADDVQFEVVSVADIRETDDYPGIRVALKANYPPISVPLTVDVTTGDMITPREVEYTFSLMFDDRSIRIFAYNLETVLAEKLETVLSRNVANTRPRDYYDIHILYALRGAECDMATLRSAMERTTQKRGSGVILTDYAEIMKDIRQSDALRRLWDKYRREYDYAKDITFDDTCETIKTIMDAITV